MKKIRVNIIVRPNLRLMESQLRFNIFLNICSFLILYILYGGGLKEILKLC